MASSTGGGMGGKAGMPVQHTWRVPHSQRGFADRKSVGRSVGRTRRVSILLNLLVNQGTQMLSRLAYCRRHWVAMEHGLRQRPSARSRREEQDEIPCDHLVRGPISMR